jgi:predicted nucleotidyltransferase
MLNDPFVQKARDIICPFLRPDDQIFLFGSRTTSTHHPFSDIDIGITSKQAISFQLMAKITGALEESDLPVRIDVIDFSKVSDAFKTIAQKSMQPL